jgi:hypothetical protein
MAEADNKIDGKKTKLDEAIKEAIALLSPIPDKEKVTEKFGEIIQKELEPDEKILFAVRQSYIHDIAPKLIVATNRKIMIVNPSLFYRYLGFNIFDPTVSQLVHYTRISHAVAVHGRWLTSIELIIVGAGEVHIGGLPREGGKLLLNFIERVTENLES